MGTRFVEFEFLAGDLRAAVRRHIHLEAFVCCRVVIGGRECAALLAVGVQLKVGRIVEREVELQFLIGEVSGRRDVCRRGIFRIRSYRRGIDTKNGSANPRGASRREESVPCRDQRVWPTAADNWLHPLVIESLFVHK
jgi:hypothetical protein